MCFRKTEGKALREKTKRERQTKMKENGKPMLPTAEEAEALTPTIRKEMKHRSEDNFREYGTRRRRQEEIAAKMGAGGAQVAYTRRGRIRFAESAFGADSAACAAAKK